MQRLKNLNSTVTRYIRLNKIFGHTNELAQIVTEEKVFGFMLYQAHRPKRKRGRKGAFNEQEYHEVLENYRLGRTTPNVVGYDVLNQVSPC